MDRKKWKTISQEITCDQCGTVVPRRTNGQRFCKQTCQGKWWTANKNMHTAVCVVCNETFTGRLKAKTCGRFCGSIYQAVNSQLYTDDEIKHLMLLNRGIGWQRFCNTIKVSEDRLLFIINMAKEEENLDLFAILNDPKRLIKMRKDEWIAKGCPPTATKHVGTKGMSSGKRQTRKKMRETYARYEQSNFEFDRFDLRTHLSVLVVPEFNWGPYGGRGRPKN